MRRPENFFANRSRRLGDMMFSVTFPIIFYVFCAESVSKITINPVH